MPKTKERIKNGGAVLLLPLPETHFRDPVAVRPGLGYTWRRGERHELVESRCQRKLFFLNGVYNIIILIFCIIINSKFL